MFDKKKIIESMGCQKGGGKILIKRMSLNSWVAKKGGGGNFDKKKIIESMGCQEGKGGGKKSLKA